MSYPRLSLLLLLGIAASCDNVGRAFDRTVDPGDPNAETGESPIQGVPAGGTVRDGRPLVRAAYPDGGGWPGTVPIVVEFSESVNEASLAPSTPAGIDGRIGVRVQGTQQLLPAQYDFLADGRLLVIRPVNALSNDGTPVYEVVLFPEARDVDGVRFLVSGGEKVLSEFQVNQSTSIEDGAIVAVFPRDNFGDATREGDVVIVFDRPANASSLVAANVSLAPANGTAITTEIKTPLTTVGVEDPRVVRLRPDSPLAAQQRYELTVTGDITFGQSGSLDFNGRTPFSVFDTVGPAAPTLVELGNPVAGFANKINRQNLLTVQLEVTTPTDALAGDVVVARIYGGDATTPQTFDFGYVERSAVLPAAGAQTIALDFAMQLGTLAEPGFDDGDITFAAYLQRGGQSSGFVHQASGAEPLFDITPPTLTQAGPPGDGANDIYTDDEYLAYYGVASEGLAETTLADGVNPDATMFGSSDSGRFVTLPLQLGRLTAVRPYTVTLTDRAGNLSATAIAGNIHQRGLLTGTLAGTLTVEAYDQATLQPISGATVLVDASSPSPTGAGQVVGTTDASGRATFSTAPTAHTITIVRAGYDLTTIYDTQAAFVSLPLVPGNEPTANLRGALAVQQTPGATAIVGSTALADRSATGIRTTNASPTEIPTTAVSANRAQIVTAFAGAFEPTAKPTFAFHGCEALGVTLVAPTAPLAPIAAGSTGNADLVLLSATGTVGSLLGPHTVDFGAATGLDTANLVDLPRARVTSSLFGFSGQLVTGIGFAALNAGAAYDIDANFSLPILAGLAGFGPVSWLMAEAEDTGGRVSRVRVLLNTLTGQIVPGTGATAIPVVAAPSGPSTGSPLVTYDDVLNPAGVPGGLGFFDLTATDGNGRRWHLLRPDRDGSGATDSVQFPDLGANNVAGLATGAWEVLVEARLVVSVTLSTADDFVLSERFRQEVNYARSQPVTFTVQ